MRSTSRVFLAYVLVKPIFLLYFMQLGGRILSTSAAASLPSGENNTDHLALLAIKASITYDPQGIVSSWNDSVHFCNWNGVTCDPNQKRVTVLDLRSRGLVGSVSSYIGNMSFLEQILLQNNTLHGEIPPEIGHLFRLQVLHLANNSFEGKIPSNLSYCSNLSFFGIQYNKLVGNVPAELSSLSKLKELYIRDNYLSGGIPPFIGNLSSLEVLTTSNNLFGGTIPDSLGKLEYLSLLGLGGNKLSGIIPSAIYNISAIQKISVADNELRGSIPSDIDLCWPRLQRLQMWGNFFSGSVPASLSNASNMESIELQQNNLTGKISVHFGGLQHLFNLDLSFNSLGSNEGDDLKFINSLQNCSNLLYLDLGFNNLSGVLPNSLGNLSSSLQNLWIDYNPIYGELPEGLPSLVSLSALIMEFTQISGTIPIEIGELRNLRVLYLVNNRLSGSVPSSLGNLSLLNDLNLEGNQLQGTIPSSLQNCHNLLFMDFSQNNFNGPIPNQLFAVRNELVSLDISQNHLVGSLPSEISSLFNLNKLLVSRNRLSGKIPNDLSRCRSLEYLDMQDNNFQGTIPASFQSLRGLRQLDLSKNNLSGKIPEYFGTLALEYLNLSFNNFEGEVPIKGIFTNATAISVAGNFRLCGGIPELKLPQCIRQASTRSTLSHVKIIAIAISCAFGIIILSGFLNWLRRKKRDQVPRSLQIKSFMELSYERILKATDGFSSTSLIGTGMFGSVYKGTLDEDGRSIAVKVLNLQVRGALKSFVAECEVLRTIRHRNLLKIITSCSSIDFQGNDFKALVYEFMPNGNLEKWLHPDSENNAELVQHQSPSLLQRINIAIDVGNALDYLHNQCEKPIIHCDIKPSNILLDNDMVAHVGDFGLAKFIQQLADPAQSSTLGVRGTVGYAAPEYGVGSEISIKGDVYSYGILLLEMMTGKKPTSNMFVEGHNIHNLCRMALQDGVLEIVDIKLLQGEEGRQLSNNGVSVEANDRTVECIIGMMKVGLECSMESPQDRVDISNAVGQLRSIRSKYMRPTPAVVAR